MNNLINKIINGEDLDEIYSFVLESLYKNGPVGTTDMEILSYLALYQPESFTSYENKVLNYMSVFYKSTENETLKDVVFSQYKSYIAEEFGTSYTPVQADIVKGIATHNCFSFSAPTSTGKSYLFLNKIQESQRDVVVVVPSRALINEYYIKLTEAIEDKSVNILTFIDKINTAKTKRNIFIVTPERCRELFRNKDDFEVELFLFDEAQLSNEESKRGLYFDSIVRRCQKAYPEAKFVFAHPFVKNPVSQIEKNHFNRQTSFSKQYTQKNVGQLFLCSNINNDEFFHFGVEKAIMGNIKKKCNYDPIKKIIEEKGSVLFYVTKAKIYNGQVFERFEKYINMCPELTGEDIEGYVNQLKEYSGGETTLGQNRYSHIITLLKRGIVIHHGSLPLSIRVLIEKFTKEGHCRICFATSTLEQGINMPFDIVFLDRLDGSKPLSVKNLIGRAGRSSMDSKFDFGYVILGSTSNMSKFRSIMSEEEILDNVSSLEKDDTGELDSDFNEFKKAILTDTYSDQYNLTSNQLEQLSSNEISEKIVDILNVLFTSNDDLVSQTFLGESGLIPELFDSFNQLYETYLGRVLEDGENDVFREAISIILWRIYNKTFKNICSIRYARASEASKRRGLSARREGSLPAGYITGYKDIPNKSLARYPLFSNKIKAKDVSYDLIMYDTYDYIDKLIGFKLSDIFYASFWKHYEKTEDRRAKMLAQLIKYGTDNSRHIWMLRYGLSFEDIELLDKHIEDINAERILFKTSITEVDEINKTAIKRFID